MRNSQLDTFEDAPTLLSFVLRTNPSSLQQVTKPVGLHLMLPLVIAIAVV